MLRALYSVFHLKSSSTPFSWQVQDLVRSADDPDVPHVVLGGSADAPPLAMEETKMSHASRFCGRRSIWRGFAESSWSRSVLDVSFKETMHHQSHYFVAAALFGGDACWPLLPRPMHMYTGRFVRCDSDAN